MYLTSVPALVQTIFPSAIWSSSQEPRLRLTFDDGPHPESTPQLLDLLLKKNIKATFFCLGERLEKYPELHQMILQQGHQVGNHGYQHLSGWTTDYQTYISNAEQGAEISASTLYRPPYGRMTPRQYQYLKAQHKIVLWTSMPGDFDPTITKESVGSEVSIAFQQEGIIVLHDTPTCIEKVLFAINHLPQQSS